MSKTLKKAFAMSLVVVSVLGAVAPASAVTIADLLAQIAALQAQLAALQSSSPSSSAVCLSKNLSYPMRDDEVKTVQTWLNVSPVSGYFGPLTRAAVVAYQKANSISPAAGYVGPLTRASLNGKYCTTPSTTPGATPAPAGSVSVVLSPSNPAGTTLVAHQTTASGAQALAPVLAVRFTAPAAAAVQVNQVVVRRSGVSADADVSNLYLYVGGAKVASSPSISSGAFTFANSAGLFTVPAGSFVDVTVEMDLANGTSAGKTFQFGILAAGDLATNAASVVGTFPMMGNSFTVAQVGDLGTMTIQSATPASNTSVDPGTTNYEVFRFSAVAANQPQQVSFMKFTLVGTADYDALQNVQLFVDGSQVGSTLAMMATDKTVTFDLSGAPVSFTSGQTRTVSLRANVVKGAGRNFYFEVANGADFVSKDMTYNVYLKTNQSNVFTLFKAAGTTSINQGSISVSKSTDSPTGPLTANTTNVKIASYDVKAIGEDIRVSQLTIKTGSTNTMNNVKVMIDGTQYGSSVSTLATATPQAYTGTYTFPAGVVKKVAVYADLTSPIVSGNSVSITFVAGSANGVLQASGTSVNVPGSDTAANTISISAGGVTAVKNSSVANISSVLNAQNVVLASWLITAPTDQGVSVNSVTINDGGNQSLGSAFDALTLWNSSTQYGQQINLSSSAAQGTASTFNFSTKLSIAAGQSVQLDLKGNVLSTASTTLWNGASGDDVRITGVDATGAATNSAVSYSSGNVDAQLVTLNSGATLTISQEASPTMPDSTYVVAGDTGVTLAAFRFAANNTEDVKVTQVKINETGAPDVPGNFTNIKLFVDGAQVGSAVPAFVNAASNTAVFSNGAGLFTVSKNSYKTVVVKADMTNKSNATFADAGEAMKISVYVVNAASTATTDVVAMGATSSQYATLAGGSAGGTYLNGNTMTFVRTRPTFAYVAPSSTTLVPGTMEVLRFRITAHSDDDVKFNSTASNLIRLTVLAGKTATGTVTLYDATNDSVLASSTGANLASGQTISFTFGSGSITVPAGQTKEFYVKADLSTFSSVGNSFQVQIANTSSDWSFNDSSTTSANISASNYVGLGFPMSGAIFVKP